MVDDKQIHKTENKKNLKAVWANMGSQPANVVNMGSWYSFLGPH
jgi:hypothetical protein